MTSAQLEPSAHAPCTSTTLRASAGLAARADAPAAKSVAESILMATTATVQSVFFFDPWMYFFTALRLRTSARGLPLNPTGDPFA